MQYSVPQQIEALLYAIKKLHSYSSPPHYIGSHNQIRSSQYDTKTSTSTNLEIHDIPMCCISKQVLEACRPEWLYVGLHFDNFFWKFQDSTSFHTLEYVESHIEMCAHPGHPSPDFIMEPETKKKLQFGFIYTHSDGGELSFSFN